MDANRRGEQQFLAGTVISLQEVSSRQQHAGPPGRREPANGIHKSLIVLSL